MKKINHKDSSQFNALMATLINASNTVVDADMSILLGNAYLVLAELKVTVGDLKRAQDKDVVELDRAQENAAKENAAKVYGRLAEEEMRHTERIVTLVDANVALQRKLDEEKTTRKNADEELRKAVGALREKFEYEVDTAKDEVLRQYALGCDYAATLIYNIIK